MKLTRLEDNTGISRTGKGSVRRLRMSMAKSTIINHRNSSHEAYLAWRRNIRLLYKGIEYRSISEERRT